MTNISGRHAQFHHRGPGSLEAHLIATKQFSIYLS